MKILSAHIELSRPLESTRLISLGFLKGLRSFGQSRVIALAVASLIVFSVSARAATSTWSGGAGDPNFDWSQAANWGGTVIPATGNTPVFGGSVGLNNTNDQATGVTGITFSAGAGAFVLSGNALTVTGNILDSAAGVNETIGMSITSDGGLARTITSATNAILTFAGSITRTTTTSGRGLDLVTGGGTYQFSGLVNLNNPVLLTTDATHSGVSQRNNTTVNLLSGASLNINGGYWAIGQNSATLTDPAAVLNVNNGASMTVSGSSDFEVGYNFNAAANANSNHGILNINNGGVFTAVFGSLADASGYIRLGLNGSTTATSITQGTVNLLSGGSLVTSRTFVTGGSLANTGVNHTAEQGNFLFDGGTLTTDGTNNANWFQSVTSGAGSQFLPMTSVAINAGGAILDTAGVNATISHAMIPGTTAGGGLTKQGAGTLTLSGNNSYTGSTIVLGGVLEITGTVAGTSSLTVINSGVFYLAGGSLSVSGAITNNGIFKLSGTPTLTQTGSFINNGVLDLINGPQSLPSNFTNNGAILNSSSVQVQQLAKNGSNFTLTIYGDPQHTFQLQRTTSLVAPVTWTNVGAPQVGTGFPLVFTDTSATGVSGFYQVLVLP